MHLPRALAAALLCLLLASPVSAEPLQLYTEEYPPVSFSENGEVDGMATEVVRELLRRLGEQASIQSLPWARSLQIVRRTPNTALYTTIRNPMREAQFKWVGPLVVSEDNFYALRGSGLQISHPEQLHALGPIAVPRAWSTYQELRETGLPNLLPVNEPEQVFRMLNHGRVRVIVADNLSFLAHGAQAQQVDFLSSADVEAIYNHRTSYGYIAFWRDTPDERVQRWQAELDAMKADGSFLRIHRRWLGDSTPAPLREP